MRIVRRLLGNGTPVKPCSSYGKPKSKARRLLGNATLPKSGCTRLPGNGNLVNSSLTKGKARLNVCRLLANVTLREASFEGLTNAECLLIAQLRDTLQACVK